MPLQSTPTATENDTMTTTIEWLGEELVDGGEDADIHDVMHAESYTSLVDMMRYSTHKRLGLVRDRRSGHDALCRSWAYIVNGKLPEYFEDAGGAQVAKVPARYHAELARASLSA
jgi:hypothetical protein